jgi:hypothetical protein
MKNAILVAIISILSISSTAFADVKIKTKQTMSGQTSENTVYFKGKRQRSEGMGGLVSLNQCDLGRDIQMNPAAKTYTISLYESLVGTTQNASTDSVPSTKGGTMYITTTTRDTGERQQMFGYTARHIIQTVEMDSSADACNPTKSKMEMDMWVIDAEFGLACDQNNHYRNYQRGPNGGCTDKVVQKNNGSGKTGYPVVQKMTFYDKDGKPSYTMTSEVVELSKTKLDASLFEVPADYREVNDSSHLYASAANVGMDPSSYQKPQTTNASLPSTNGFGDSVSKAAGSRSEGSAAVSEKKPGTIRIGVPAVKTGSVGTGVSANDLAAAVQNSLGDFLKGTNVEIVPLEARLATAWANEAKQKECDYILLANVSHKKGGGGGFGGFGKVIGAASPMIPLAGGMTGAVAGQVISTAITASTMSGSMKSKDEITLEMKLQSAGDNSVTLNKQYRAKAKSDGDDIISAVIEQAAQAIMDAIGK